MKAGHETRRAGFDIVNIVRVGELHYRTIWPVGETAVEIIDQRLLPHAFATRKLRSVDEVVDAIRSMAVRGAPLIGAAGAYGLALAMRGACRRALASEI